MTRFDTPAAQAAMACCQMATARGSPAAAPAWTLPGAEAPSPASQACRATPLPDPSSSSVRRLARPRQARQSMTTWPTSASERGPAAGAHR